MAPAVSIALAVRLALSATATAPTAPIAADTLRAASGDTIVAATHGPAAPAASAPTNPARTTPAGPPPAPAVAAPPAELTVPISGTADSVVVEKGARRLTLFRSGRAVRSYLVALGANPTGPKRVQGDGRTPEGLYRIDYRNPQSRYHRALHISYPSARDRQAAAALGRAPGGDIMIHGLPPRSAAVGAAHRTYDWTEGCVAVTNAEIEEIWRAVPDGTPVEIKP